MLREYAHTSACVLRLRHVRSEADTTAAAQMPRLQRERAEGQKDGNPRLSSGAFCASSESGAFCHTIIQFVSWFVADQNRLISQNSINVLRYCSLCWHAQADARRRRARYAMQIARAISSCTRAKKENNANFSSIVSANPSKTLILLGFPGRSQVSACGLHSESCGAV